MAINYKIIKYCRSCRARFTVNKGESKIIYCEDCQIKLNESVEE